jgi:putative transposase
VRDQFLVEVAAREVAGLVELNRLFAAWVETVYHRRVHSETKAPPLERFEAAGPSALPTPAQLHEAFLWSQRRMVTKTATVSLFGNTFEVDAALVGRRVELVFDPFDLASVEVRFEGRSMGSAVAHVLRRHTHPMARPEAASPPAASGIDYLGLVESRHAAELANHIDYVQLRLPPELLPQPLDLPGLQTTTLKTTTEEIS